MLDVASLNEALSHIKDYAEAYISCEPGECQDCDTLRHIAAVANAALCDFDTVQDAAKRLREIMERDFPDSSPHIRPVPEGTEAYVIRAVMEAVFGKEPLGNE